ncbi:DUF4167 domain-containing protein [Phyllobacterium myrsinacearum]|uniref:DUF4167 domain-containing protein n=1 Tax=Phyllobacterium myrsinacearum TaxID=28101 RepID=UPI0015FA447A
MNMNLTKSRPSGARAMPLPGKATGAQSSRLQKAQLSYERYLAQARAEALVGNRVEAENYYQHAEHYFRSIRADDK